MNIYQISQDLISIFDEIEENEGELTPELEEKLAITQDTFKDKIKSYVGVIKMLTSDVANIKEEMTRLRDLQISKEKTITRLKDILITAVETFGDTTKAGGRYIDYGTGKLSVRYNKTVLVEDNAIDRFINRLMTGFKWYANNNQLDASIVNLDDIMDYANSKSPSEEEDDVEISTFDVKDLERLTASIDLDIDIKSLISTKTGIDLLRALLKHNMFRIKAKADKKAIKDDATNEGHYMPTYAKLITNKSITVK